MPEGPSLVILKEKMLPFKGRKITAVSGNAKINMELRKNKKILDFKTWGKQLFICLKNVSVRIHLFMFGSASINENTKPERSLRLRLQLGKDVLDQ